MTKEREELRDKIVDWIPGLRTAEYCVGLDHHQKMLKYSRDVLERGTDMQLEALGQAPLSQSTTDAGDKDMGVSVTGDVTYHISVPQPPKRNRPWVPVLAAIAGALGGAGLATALLRPAPVVPAQMRDTDTDTQYDLRIIPMEQADESH